MVILASVFVMSWLHACKQTPQYVPYNEIDLYQQSFDKFGSDWNRFPRTSSAYQDSCVFVEEGVLKMILRPGEHGCGGCSILSDLKLVIEENSAFHPVSLEKFGMELTLNKGHFQQLEYHYDTLNEFGESVRYMQYLKKSSLFLNFNRFSIVLPSYNFGRYYNDTNFDLNENRIDGLHFELIYDYGEKHMYIDGVEVQPENIQIGAQRYGSQNWPLKIQLELERNSRFIDDLEELYIDDLRLYTWDGQKEY